MKTPKFWLSVMLLIGLALGASATATRSFALLAPQASATKKDKAAKTGSKLDINTATKEELEALPGIGPATSAKIVEGRPYRAKSDLVKRKIVPESTYDKI
jgi:competence protein ComEA